MTEHEAAKLLALGKEWHSHFSKAFITSVSAEGEYFIKIKFKTMAEMHEAYRAMARLAEATKTNEENK